MIPLLCPPALSFNVSPILVSVNHLSLSLGPTHPNKTCLFNFGLLGHNPCVMQMTQLCSESAIPQAGPSRSRITEWVYAPSGQSKWAFFFLSNRFSLSQNLYPFVAKELNGSPMRFAVTLKMMVVVVMVMNFLLFHVCLQTCSPRLSSYLQSDLSTDMDTLLLWQAGKCEIQCIWSLQIWANCENWGSKEEVKPAHLPRKSKGFW